MKQETLEEAIEKYAEIYRCPATNTDEYCKHDIISAINFGAKWQAERSYSEEEVYNLLLKYQKECSYVNNGNGLKHWFNQFKKK